MPDLPSPYLERLARRTRAVGSVLCLGIDPDPAGLPPGFSGDLAGIEAFATLLVEAAGPSAAAVKANLAFFEAYGSAGIAALERVRARIPADLPFIADAKRGRLRQRRLRPALLRILRGHPGGNERQGERGNRREHEAWLSHQVQSGWVRTKCAVA